ncbi:MAG: hypothetical protein HQK49_03980 [Oligoflexia bacterium]|nr:hypothetical protein [Oligoflexia bacterium]
MKIILILLLNVLLFYSNIVSANVKLFSDFSEEDLNSNGKFTNEVNDRIKQFKNKKLKYLQKDISYKILKINPSIQDILNNNKPEIHLLEEDHNFTKKTIWGEDANPSFANYFKIDKDEVEKELTEITINIDSDRTIVAKKTKIIQNIVEGKEYLSWIGKVVDDDLSLVVVTLRENNLSAQISSQKMAMNIKPLGNGLHAVYNYGADYRESISTAGYAKSNSLDRMQSDFLEISAELHEKISRKNPPRGGGASADDDGSFVDVMIVYTSNVNAASADIGSEITTDIAYANEALTQSCALFRLRLVYSGTVTYTETGDSTKDLCAVTGDDDINRGYGYDTSNTIPEVNGLRDTYGADLVQFWVETNRDYCGIAWAPSINSSNAMYGYSVKIRTCDSSTSIHEMGHNLTLAHDRYEMDISLYDVGAFRGGGYGYVNTALKVTDIMAYTTECGRHNLSCYRLPYFSNPRILYKGIPFGIAKISDEVETLNRSKDYIANYRPAISSYSVDVTSGCLETKSNQKNVNSCFIATAAYGSYLDPHVKILRDFRDNFLYDFTLGDLFIKLYEKYSPSYAKKISKNKFLMILTRVFLTPVVGATWVFINYPFIFFLLILPILFVFPLILSAFVISTGISFIILFLILILMISTSQNIYSYVAAPLVDPNEHAKNPAIIAFKKDAVIIGTRLSTGDRKFKIGSKERETDEITTLEAVASLNTHSLGIEGFYFINNDKKRTEVLKSESTSSTIENANTGANIAYKIFKFLSSGIHYSQETITHGGQNYKTLKIGGGTAIAIANFIYIGGGGNYVKNEGTYYPKNTWKEYMAGVGINFKSSDQIFRVEASYISSPESIVAASGVNGSNYHPKNTSVILSAESILTSSIVQNITSGIASGVALGITKESTTNASLQAGDAEEKINKTRYYLMLLLMQRHLYLGASLTEKDNIVLENKSEESIITFSAAYNF